MLKNITLHFSELPNSIEVSTQGVTIFVGPNNSGKSLLLKEIEQAFRLHGKVEGFKILDGFEIVWPTKASIEQDLDSLSHRKPQGSNTNIIETGYFQGRNFQSKRLVRDQIIEIAKGKTDKNWFAAEFLTHFLVRLDGRTRFELSDDDSMGDLLSSPSSMLAAIFRDNKVRKKIRDIVFDAFGLHLVIDPTNLGTARIRLSEQPPGPDEQSLNEEARNFHKAAAHIKEASDGLQAFVGIIASVISGEYRAILIDEPEAFLHPPLARKLGKELAKFVSTNKGSLLASTHSADFLMGCVHASKDVRIVRLEYYKGKSKGRVVDPQLLEQVFRSPLMRSANVVSALFYDGVVVTESDNDRAFYAEIYYRLTEVDPSLPSILFINAQNKQTIKNIVKPLRGFGIPAAAIPDIDILKDGGSVWAEWLEAAAIPNALHPGLALTRHNVKDLFVKASKDMKRDGGTDALAPAGKSAAEKLFDDLDEYGVFVVRRGEIEKWLPTLGAVGMKTDWTVSALEKMGSDPTSVNYLTPASDDAWEFMRKIAKWVGNPSRKGTY